MLEDEGRRIYSITKKNKTLFMFNANFKCLRNK